METVHESLVMVQLFMAVVACTALVLGAAKAERDAAERARAADFRALEVGTERLRLALDAARMGVWDWNIETGAVQWSENLESIHGMARGAFSGTLDGFRRVVDPVDDERVDRAMRRAIDEGGGYEVEFRSRFSDGTLHWLAATGRVVKDENGKPHMLGTAMDVTARHQLEDELRERAEQLIDADRRKDEFLAMLGHELRNPLAPLSASLELLGQSGADRERFLAVANRQVKHLVRLVDDLLDVSRITRGKIALRRESVAIADVIEQAIELSRPLIDTQRQTLSVAPPREPLRVDGDRDRLAQALSNLLVNASNYTPSGGSLDLGVECAGSEIAIRVRDSGIGIAPDLMPHIFDPFVQGESTPDRPRGGLGIGLTLVRALVEMHAGRVEARSAGRGRGSEFTIRLPLSSAAAGEAEQPFATAPSAEPRLSLRILIVEDNADAAEGLQALLAREGHQVRLAGEALEALAIASTFAPDVVLSDLGLPGIDGYELAARLRASPSSAAALLVAISGYGRDEDKERAAKAGFDEHFIKPLDIDRLRSLLRRAGAAAA
jgi:PAS domain S-box-containing protein